MYGKYPPKKSAKILESVGQSLYDSYRKGSISDTTYTELVQRGLIDKRSEVERLYEIVDEAPLEETLPVGEARPIDEVGSFEEALPEEQPPCDDPWGYVPPPRPEPLNEDARPVKDAFPPSKSNASDNHEYDILPVPGEIMNCAPPPLAEEDEAKEIGDQPEADSTGRASKGEDIAVEKTNLRGWALLWCFRCTEEHTIEFGEKMLPEWIQMDGKKEGPLILPICCKECNKRFRMVYKSRKDEEVDIEKSLQNLRLDATVFGDEPRRVAQIMTGQDVQVMTRNGSIAHVDIDEIREGLIADDKVETVDIGRFRNGEISNLGLGCMVGGLF